MARTSDKIVLGVLIVMLIGLSSVLITALGIEVAPQTTSQTREISPEEAKSVALSAVPGTFQKLEVETENGKPVYEVEIKSQNVVQEVKIDLQGRILGIETDEDEEISSSELEKIDGLITEERAKEIALERVAGKVIDFETEREGNRIVYGVEVDDGTEIAEVEIDASTGEILEVEYDDDDDDD